MIFILFYFPCLGAISAFEHMCCVHSWGLRMSEEGVGSSGSGVMKGYEPTGGILHTDLYPL